MFLEQHTHTVLKIAGLHTKQLSSIIAGGCGLGWGVSVLWWGVGGSAFILYKETMPLLFLLFYLNLEQMSKGAGVYKA